MDTDETVKDRILERAMKLFLAHGFTGTSVKDLTEAAGIAKGTLYCHFVSKDQVLESILVEYSAEFLDKLVEAVTNCEGDFVTKFRVFYRFNTEFARDSRELLLVFNTLLGEIIGSGSGAELKIKRIQAEHNLFVENMLTEGQQNGAVDKNLNAHIYAHIITATFTGMLIQWYLNADSIDDTIEYARSFRDAMMKTLGMPLSGHGSKKLITKEKRSSKRRGI